MIKIIALTNQFNDAGEDARVHGRPRRAVQWLACSKAVNLIVEQTAETIGPFNNRVRLSRSFTRSIVSFISGTIQPAAVPPKLRFMGEVTRPPCADALFERLSGIAIEKVSRKPIKKIETISAPTAIRSLNISTLYF